MMSPGPWINPGLNLDLAGVLTLIILLSKRSFQKALRLIGTEHTAELYLAR